MTEIKLKEPLQEVKSLGHLDLLFEIYKLKTFRKSLTSKLKSFEKSLKSGYTSSIQYKFEALKVIITENELNLKNLTEKVSDEDNLFTLIKNLEESKIYLENLRRERERKRIDLEHFEIAKGYYLQRMIDIRANFGQLKSNALSYSKHLKEVLIGLEDQRIVLTAEKMRKNISKEEFKRKLEKIEDKKQRLEEKLAFLKVEIIDYNLE